MKVQDLIDHLQTFDPQLELATASFEFGFVRLESLTEIEVLPVKQSGTFPINFRLPANIDQSNRMKIVCCGPVDPGFITLAEESAQIN